MHRNPLLEMLHAHKAWDAEEEKMRLHIIEFVSRNPACFERSLEEGHITGAAWIVDRNLEQVVLLHHMKLGKWLQPGGHADGDPDPIAVASKEAEEETALKTLKLASHAIFDVDVHSIPARKQDPEHFHFDIRFLFYADPAEKPISNSESRSVEWVPMEKVADFNSERSILRMVERVEALKKA